MVLIVGRNSEQTVCYYSSRILKINRPGSQTEARPVVANTNVSFFKTEQPSATQSSTNGAVSATPGFVPAVTLEANKASGNGAEPAKRLINLPEPSGASLFNMGTPKVSVDTGNVKPEWTGFFAHQTSSSTEEKKTLSGPLFSGSTVPIATGGLFANILPAAEPVKAPVEEKPAPVVEQPKVVLAAEEKPKVENPTQPSSGLSGLFGNGTQPANGGLFGNTKPPGTSLFGDLKGGSSSLFGTNTSFFADTKVGGEKKDENKDQGSGKPAFEASGLFGATGTSYIKTKSGLFDGLLNSNVSNGTGCGSGLMGNTTAPETSLFSRPSGTAAAGGDDDEDAGVDPDEEVVPGQEDKADPSKATGNYKYESKTEVLVVKSVNNYKKGTVPALGVGSASIEKYENGTTYLIFRNGAKVILHNTMVIKKVSKSGFMKGRTDAIWVDTFEIQEGKPTMITCKLQFNDEESCVHFKKVFDELVGANLQ